MKNRIFLFCLLAALAVSCMREQQEVVRTFSDDPVFYATIENSGDPETRVFVDDQLRVLWNADDRVSIFNKTTFNREYRFEGQDGDNSGTFDKVPGDKFIASNPLNYVYSVYPYNENTSISNDGEITVYLPAQQTYRADSFGLGANTMIAITDEDELIFKNLCGYFAVKLYGENVAVSSITLKGNNNELLAGKATVVAQTGAAPTIQFDAENATKELTITFATPVTIGTTAETATTFWFVVPPTTFENGITLTVNDNNNGAFEKSASTPLEIKRNTLKKGGVLDSTIQPNNVIYYTSITGDTINPSGNSWGGVSPIANSYENGRGKITFDGEVTSIGEFAFENCVDLTSIKLPNGVLSLGHKSFFGCTQLTSLEIPDGVSSIPVAAFRGCEKLLSVKLPEHLNSIMAYAFAECSSLTGIELSNDLISIGESAFSRCENLEEIDLPESLQQIGQSAFYRCDKLCSVVIPSGITQIAKSTFSCCGKMSSIIIPDGVTRIDQFAFMDCSSLTDIKIPPHINRIYQFTFCGCDHLRSINIPTGVNRIDDCAFKECERLTSIKVPDSVSTIEEQAFYGCSALDTIIIYSPNPPVGSDLMFAKTNNCPIYVPAESVEAYKTAEYWSDYAGRIQPLAPLPEAVDLGLSVKWASFNLGASTPEGYGDYYAWGETELKEDYSWSAYKWCNGSSTTLTKYNTNSSYGQVDNKTVLDSEDDAAHVNLGDTWRMPTWTEFLELIENCNVAWTTENGVYGRRFTSKKEGHTDKSIFLPATGAALSGSSLINAGANGDYCSSSLISDSSRNAYFLYFDSKGVGTGKGSRCIGRPVRPVLEKSF